MQKIMLIKLHKIKAELGIINKCLWQQISHRVAIEYDREY